MTATGPGSPVRRQGEDVWKVIEPLGYLDSIQAAGAFASPILAGASFTLAALTLQAGKPFSRWPDIALLGFVGAGLALIYAVQAIVWARRYTITPDDLARWYPADFAGDRPTAWLKRHQESHARQALTWAGRSRGGYHAGILLLLVGVALALVPPGHIAAMRWVVIGVAVAGVAGEVGWIALATYRSLRQSRLAGETFGQSASPLAGDAAPES
jgi:hypothetical protein